MTRCLATVAMMLTALPVYAQTYRCKNPDGISVFQQIPCAVSGDRLANTEQTRPSIEPQCAPLIAGDTEYFRCAAEVSCDRSGSFGTTRAQCIERKRQELQRDASSRRLLAEVRKAATEREKQRQQEAATEKAEAEKP